MDPDLRKALLKRYRVTSGKRFRLSDHDPADKDGVAIDEAEGRALLEEGVERLAALQAELYADGRWALLAVFQAMDAGGKDGTIKHVMSGVNPQGVDVVSFKQPGPVELGHGFLWRISKALPRRGHIGIHNRSHYEEVLVTRVHPELLDRQHLRGHGHGHKFWRHRYRDIRNFEAYLGRQGTVTVKFFLHVSKAEQRERFLARLDDPDKNWKFSAADLAERQHWDAYQQAYEDAIAATATSDAPWFVVPADRKWYAHLVVVEAMIHALERMRLSRPPPEGGLDEARRQLEVE